MDNLISRRVMAISGVLFMKNCNCSAQGLVSPMERASAARMAAAKPHGWVHAALGMGDAGPCA
ncbi:MAG: hypothetical protein JXK94_05240, partial [Deltaproteobacteria bacterium]|nr:hypothetical protein [Deltaproteobacteria bacterium]